MVTHRPRSRFSGFVFKCNVSDVAFPSKALVFLICWLTKIAYFVLLTDLMVGDLMSFEFVWSLRRQEVEGNNMLGSTCPRKGKTPDLCRQQMLRDTPRYAATEGGT